MLLALVRVAIDRPEGLRLPGPLGSSQAWLLAALAVWVILVVSPFGIPEMAAMLCITAIAVLVLGGVVLPLRPGFLVRAMAWRPLVAIGVAAYSLYLWHDPILGAVTTLVTPTALLGLLAISVPLIAAVTVLSYRIVEVPALRLRRRWVPPVSGVPASAARPRRGG